MPRSYQFLQMRPRRYWKLATPVAPILPTRSDMAGGIRIMSRFSKVAGLFARLRVLEVLPTSRYVNLFTRTARFFFIMIFSHWRYLNTTQHLSLNSSHYNHQLLVETSTPSFAPSLRTERRSGPVSSVANRSMTSTTSPSDRLNKAFTMPSASSLSVETSSQGSLAANATHPLTIFSAMSTPISNHSLWPPPLRPARLRPSHRAHGGSSMRRRARSVRCTSPSTRRGPTSGETAARKTSVTSCPHCFCHWSSRFATGSWALLDFFGVETEPILIMPLGWEGRVKP
ncbi:hypothetical protein B0H67DRAFT_328025 [Lasiosphaeris hirsuta]|uniref:Uncharacterized protein n=1 Tax=Lasiosphaeris hirsuta TaxID=260670 RepID=A0AA40A2G7_9PEZI|nr:hypothetical protein B0H67DRAFT_328025 [Lasiosphaeris hirsuta]